ncbi:protein takeout-like [Euwallacea fornicatus]|uniref:protein takeout-like n=1 Tax=Euwallacea fornicatus TaxID=995702 RepID=UPI00338E96EE
MWKIVITGFFLLVLYSRDVAAAKGLPSYLKLCHKGIPNLNECIIENLNILRPRMKVGIPELLIPSLDPLIIPEATLSTGSDFKATFRDLHLYRTDAFVMDTLNFDIDKYIIDIKIHFPSIRITSNYTINGRILVLNLNGNGPADGNYTNIRTELSLKGTPFQKNNKTFVKWNREKIDIQIESVHLLFERIFGDNAALNDQTNRVINENIGSIIEELKPVTQQIIGDFIFNLINRLFARYSISDLFPK